MKRIKENNGTAIILMLVVVSVLFIFTSFLVRKVITNTTMVEKSGQEQESYAIAKQGILYALDKLNTWQGTAPDYDSTAWLNGENWDAGNWNSYDLNGDGETEVEIRIDKDDIPHPEDSDPAFDSADDDNEDQSYITIESRDSARKLVTLQAIAKNNSPLLDYVRFINSDTVLEDDFFAASGSGSTSLIQGNAPFCVLGNVGWASGSSNDLRLSDNNKALIYGTISNDGVDELKINDSSSKQGYSYFSDPDDSSYDDPDLFDTAEGHYFSSAHLPSCYDYSETPSPVYYYGGPQSVSWPEIKETRYQNLASGTNCYIDNDTEINKETEWTDHNNDNTANDNDTVTEWFQDVVGSSTSWRYYPYAPRLILNTTNISQKLSDGTVNTIDYSDVTNGIIYAEGDISLSGILPDGKQLTIVSGGNIFIDSNLLKEINTASLALLAKHNIVLNPTTRYAVTWASPDSSWQDGSGALANPGDGNSTYPGTATISIPSGIVNTYIIDLDLGKFVTGGRIVLWDYEDGGSLQIKTTLDVFLSRDGTTWNTVLTGENPDGNFPLDFTPQTFRWIRLELQVKNDHPQPQDFNLSSEGFDAIEVPIYAVDAALFTENGTIQVVTGGGVAQDESILPNNNAYQPDAGGLRTPSDSGSYSQRLFFWGTLTETEWTESIPGWGYIAYAYDDNLSLNPPPSLPPSVGLVSLKRK
ncbi:hypothetical protein CEE34_01590 [Candidatus Aerophobetes bacterium Ae_b3a]|nr:MAG: hypothetical protein CEE34_01590 [Candidatus Aerophobetes bacterium Ae_b3a]